MNILLIGNIVGLAGSVLMVLIGLIKTKKNILLAQSLQFALMAVSNGILGGVTGMISNLISIVRNLIICRVEFTLPLKIFFLAVQGGLSLIFNKVGLIGWLPFIAVVLYTWFLDCKDEITLKRVILIAQVLWTIYDLYFRNYTTAAFDVFTMISTFAGIILIRKSRAKEGERP